MSWSNWSEQGYGFKLFNGKNDRQVRVSEIPE